MILTRSGPALLLMLWIACCLHPWAIPVLAAEQSDGAPQRVEAVVISGNRRIPESTILYYLQVKENDPYNVDLIRRDFRNLLNTDFFSDARVTARKGATGMIVTFEVTERPLIRSIEYQGLKSFKESDILEQFRDQKVGLSIDSPFDESRLRLARKALRLLLEMNGRPLGRVESRVEAISSSAVKLIFEFDEGPKVRIGDIQFEGNTALSDDELRDALELDKVRGLFTLFKGHDKYIPDKLEYDIQANLIAKYQSIGYIMAKAGDPDVEIAEAPQGLLIGFRKTPLQHLITIPIEEGPQFRIGDLEVDGVKTFDPRVIQATFKAQKGEIVDYSELKKAVEDLREIYSTLGFLDAAVQPEINPHVDTGILDIKVHIDEGNRYTVDRIEFSGNTKTRDRVLRREFLLGEQQDFNSRLLDLSIRRLNQLGFLEKIEDKDYDVVKDPQHGEVDVLVKVKERSQQSIGLTGGVSGISGSFIGLSYQSNNFRGTGQQLAVQVMTGTQTSNYQLSLTQPYFLDTRMSLGWSIFSRRYRYDTYTAYSGLISPEYNVDLYTQHMKGFSVSGGYPVGRWSRAGIGYSFQEITIGNIADVFESYALNQLVGFTPGGSTEDARSGLFRSEVTPSFSINTKNAYFGATEGSQLTLQLPIAGGPFGGDYSLIRPQFEYQKFWPDSILSGGRNSFAIRLRAQHIIPFGTTSSGQRMTAPFFERIFTGGEFALRGFNIRSVSPYAITRTPRLDNAGHAIIDSSTGLPLVTESVIPVGGDTSYLATGEYRIPVVGPLELHCFADFGTSAVLRKENLQVFGPDTFVDLIDVTNNALRMSTGFEVQFLLPVINQPFRLIWAYNPMRLDTTFTVQGVELPVREPTTNVTFSVGYNF